LGYSAVIVGLLADLGLPWNIWRPTVYWQHHSVLFEVAWCVMLYTAVLGLEFLPSALEHPLFKSQAFQTIVHWLKRLTLPLVIAGIVLSTLHQSSLGSLLLIVPFRVHELWYSPILPVLFFVSAAALGLMMVTLEGFFSSFVYRRRMELELFSGLGKAAAVILWVYLGIRIGDLVWRGVLPGAIDGSWQSVLFLASVHQHAYSGILFRYRPPHSLNGLGTAVLHGLRHGPPPAFGQCDRC
jgi:Ni/Fe-hydrogenase subunit HybB-like protein